MALEIYALALRHYISSNLLTYIQTGQWFSKMTNYIFPSLCLKPFPSRSMLALIPSPG